MKIRTIQYLLKKNKNYIDNWAIFKRFYVSQINIVKLLILFCILQSCAEWGPEKGRVVARVGDVFLYSFDLNEQFNGFKNKSDSLLKTRKFVDSWAKNEILLQLATRNLNNQELQDLENMISQYRFELFSKKYIQSVVNNFYDTLVNNYEIDSFLLANKGVFNLNTPLYKVRFIHIPPNNVDILEIESSFQRFNQEDRSFLDSLSFQFNNYLLADSIWLKKRDLISEVDFLNQQNAEKYLKKSQFFRVEDSLGVYLLFIDKLLKKGETTPKVFLRSTIRNIIIKQRKLKLTKKFEKEIINDAIKSKTYEIY